MAKYETALTLHGTGIHKSPKFEFPDENALKQGADALNAFRDSLVADLVSAGTSGAMASRPARGKTLTLTSETTRDGHACHEVTEKWHGLTDQEVQDAESHFDGRFNQGQVASFKK